MSLLSFDVGLTEGHSSRQMLGDDPSLNVEKGLVRRFSRRRYAFVKSFPLVSTARLILLALVNI